MTTITAAAKKGNNIPALLAGGNNDNRVPAKPISIDNPRFIHLRHHPIIGSEEDGRVYYGHALANGGVTVAYYITDIVDHLQQGPEGKLVNYAVAKCCESDTFNKSVARAKSSGRLKSISEKTAHLRGEFLVPHDMTIKEIDTQLRTLICNKYNLAFNVF